MPVPNIPVDDYSFWLVNKISEEDLEKAIECVEIRDFNSFKSECCDLWFLNLGVWQCLSILCITKKKKIISRYNNLKKYLKSIYRDTGEIAERVRKLLAVI